ncbi:tRNA (guanosine(37)-N1)-methyltransferase TrmD [Candidatus Gottesmanbacteria bacterium]|nr:tRNA (guanosine(37)-N1)-methyltransferase TrmD [Candidatus Gottesmanbacteria bacterium]
MKIAILTLFPAMFSGPFSESIVKRSQNKKIVEIEIDNLRNWAIDKRGTVDEKPYGGGVGMVLRPEPIFNAIDEILGKRVKRKAVRVVLLSASGSPYTQKKAIEYSKLDSLILICGHYEGVDQRVIDHVVDEEISIGDYVLTGGEIPAMVVVDSIVRLIPGVLENPEAIENESFSQDLLEYPQYTRPEEFMGYKVPSVLLGGNHKKIEKWRKEKSIEKTKKVRPDLLK